MTAVSHLKKLPLLSVEEREVTMEKSREMESLIVV
jgi:hypothetical protein